MGWGSGYLTLPKSGEQIEAGYLIDDVCHEEECEKEIDRGLAYRCGGTDFDYGCGWYFCPKHLYCGNHHFLCKACSDEEDDEEEEVEE